MKIPSLIIILLFLISSHLLSQDVQLPLDFESDAYEITNFSGGELHIIPNPESNSENPSANVGQMIKYAGETWGGSFISLSNPIDFSGSTKVSMKVFSPRIGVTVLLKLEHASNNSVFIERTISTSVVNEWEILEFDFSGALANSYSKVVLIFDNGILGNGSADFTFLIDDIQLLNPNQPSLSDLLADGTTIGGFTPTIQNYTIELSEGTTIIPAITAVASDPTSTVVINPTIEIPGTTTIAVTTADESTTTYNVYFYIQGSVCSDGFTGNEPGINDYELIWLDDFLIDGAPCSENWGYDIGAGGWGNGESQYYTDRLDNSYVRNGVLTIKAIKENYGDSHYTSARLLSKNKFDFTYGKVEIRAMLPTEDGTWSALWMLGSDFSAVGWPACGEIDIMEHTGNNENFVLGTTHNLAGYGGEGVGGSVEMPTPSEFHIYSIEWNENQIKFMVDGAQFFVYSPSNKTSDNYPYTKDFFLIMNIAMGGTLGGNIDPGFTNATMVIDYVKVYQKANANSLQPSIGAPNPPFRNAENVISIFSDAYINTSGVNFNPNWEQNTLFTFKPIEGNNTLKYSNFNYQGIEYSHLDVSKMDFLHIDLWSANENALHLSCVSSGPVEKPYPLNIAAEEWVSYNIPMTYFSDVVDLTDVFQFKFDQGTGGTFYVDNIYFYEDLSSDATLKSLIIDGLEIEDFSPEIHTYLVELPPGRTLLPLVNAVTNKKSTEFEIIPVCSIPGTTSVIVTAEDGSTLTYSVLFSYRSFCPIDLDGSGRIGGGDILEAINYWGVICE